MIRKRIIATILAIVVMAQMIICVNAENNTLIKPLTTKESMLLEIFGINPEMSNDNMTKEEFFKNLDLIINFCGETANEITGISEETSNIENMYFLPEEEKVDIDEDTPLSKVDAYYSVLSLLGYPVIDKYDSNIPIFVSTLGISKGINSTEIMNKADSYRLLCNTLYAETIKEFGSTSSFVKSGKSFMSDRLSIYEISGRVTDNGINSVSGVSVLANGEIAIDGVSFYDKAEIGHLYGYQIFGFAYMDQDAILLKAQKDKNNNTITFNSDDIVNFENMTYTYYSSQNHIKKVKIDTSIEVVYNGITVKTTDNFNYDMFDPSIDENGNKTRVGTVTILDSGSGCEIIFIDSYTTHIADGINQEEQQLLYTDGKVDLSDKDYVILNSKDEQIRFWDIPQKTIVHEGASLGKEYYIIRAITDEKIGKVTGFSGEEICFYDGEIYEVSSFFLNQGKTLMAGYTYKVSLDMFGKVANAVTIASGENDIMVAFFFEFKMMDDEEVVARMYSPDAGYFTIELNDKVTFFARNSVESIRKTEQWLYEEFTDSERSAEHKVMNVIPQDQSNYKAGEKSIEGIVRYQLNNEGHINMFEIPLAPGIECSDEGRYRQFIHNSNEEDPIYFGHNYTYRGYPFYSFVGGPTVRGTVLYYDVNAEHYREKILTSVPGSRTNMKCCNVYGSNALTKEGEYTVYYYDENVYNSFQMSESFPAVVSNIKPRITEDYEVEYVVTLVDQSSTKTYTIEKEQIENAIDVTNQVVDGGLEKGDIIEYAASNGKLIRYAIVYDADYEGYSATPGFLSNAKTNKHSTDPTVVGNPLMYSFSVTTDTSANMSVSAVSDQAIEKYIKGSGRNAAVMYPYAYSNKIMVLTTQDLSQKTYNAKATYSKNNVITLTYPYVESGSTYYMTITKDGKKLKVNSSLAGDIRPYSAYGHECSKIVLVRHQDHLVFFIYNEL